MKRKSQTFLRHSFQDPRLNNRSPPTCMITHRLFDAIECTFCSPLNSFRQRSFRIPFMHAEGQKHPLSQRKEKKSNKTQQMKKETLENEWSKKKSPKTLAKKKVYKSSCQYSQAHKEDENEMKQKTKWNKPGK